MSPTADNCCDGSCPEVVSTINLNTTEIDASNALTLAIDNSGAASSTKSIALQVIDEDGDNVAGSFRIRLWFVDTNDKDAQRSLVPPDNPGSAELDIVTDETGAFTLSVSHGLALDEWYVCAALLGLVYIDGPLNLGV